MEEDMNNVLLYCKPLSFKEKRLVLGMRAISEIIYTIFQVFLSTGKLLENSPENLIICSRNLKIVLA